MKTSKSARFIRLNPKIFIHFSSKSDEVSLILNLKSSCVPKELEQGI